MAMQSLSRSTCSCRWSLVVVPIVGCLALLAACSSGTGSAGTELASDPSFGGNETGCASTVLANEDDDQVMMTQGAECFVSQTEAGLAVVWDLIWPTTDGDPIYYRYIFDGTDIWILEDPRADEFGNESPSSLRCTGIESTSWEPVGVGCVADDSLGFDGFPEAD